MDQGTLVTEQIEAGARLADEFGKFMPLQAAFWLKPSDDGQWFLYLASDQMNDTNVRRAYGEVVRILGPGRRMWLDTFQVKVMAIDNPVAKSVLEIQHKYAAVLPTRLHGGRFGDLTFDEAYIYALPISAPNLIGQAAGP
ncbi:MAG: hypothetical protein HYS13_18830 [Planctomycetia bacterium]|nr:hypothetical protein [Planctomycetia bacterium]